MKKLYTTLREPTVRTAVAISIFSVAGILSLAWNTFTPYSLPQALFYTVLLYNTLFSIPFFARITPDTWEQTVADTFLVGSYIALAYTLGNPLLFPLAATLLFILATIKYVLLYQYTAHTRTVRKKIYIDIAGALFCALVSGIAYLNFPLLAAWILMSGFTIANIHLLHIRNMYHLLEEVF